MALSNTSLDYDAIVIGAGIAGLYQLYRLRELGMTVRVFERGTGVGGTWYWNRYPGARFDSESYSYAYSFSQELLDEWDWSEHFAGQPETLRYLQYVADKFDLLKDIQFSSEVKSAVYDDDTRSWTVQLEDGSTHRSRFLITAVGNLSEPTLPRIEGNRIFWRTLLSHLSVASHSRKVHGQTGGGYRNRRYWSADNPGSIQRCRASHCLPASTKLVRPSSQLEDRSG